MPLFDATITLVRALLYLIGNMFGGVGLVFLFVSFRDGRQGALAIGFIVMALVFDWASRAGRTE